MAHRIADQEASLVKLRSDYAKASVSKKKTMEQKIVRAEESLFSLYRQQRDAVLLYRRLEQ